MGAGETVIESPTLSDRERVERYEKDYARLEDFLAKEFPFDFSEGELIVDRAVDLLKRYKRLLMTTTLPL